MFIGRDERTALRWARQGMPVHHFPTGRRGRVFASREEITNWLSQRIDGHAKVKRRPPWMSYLRWESAVVGIVASAFILSAIFLSSQSTSTTVPDRVTRVTFTENAVLAWDGNRQLWKHHFPHQMAPEHLPLGESLNDFVRIVDVGQHGKQVVILAAPFSLGLNLDSSFETTIDCFASSGKLLWSYVPHETFQLGQYELHGPWNVTALFVSDTNHTPSVWVAGEHY